MNTRQEELKIEMHGKFPTCGNIVYQTNSSTYYTNRAHNMFFEKFNGFNVSIAVLELLKSKNVDDIVITHKRNDGTKVSYRTKLQKFHDSKKIWIYIDKDTKEKDPQKGVDINEMEIVNLNELSQNQNTERRD